MGKNKKNKEKKEKKEISTARKVIRSILLIILTAAIVYVLYFFVILSVWEPSTKLTETSTDPVIYEDLTLMKKTLGDEYPYFLSLEQLMTKRTDEEMDASLLPVPGVEATTTLNSKGTKKKMCTSMTPQGIVACDDGIFISAYCHSHQHRSVIYYMSLEGELLETIVLNSKSHVGGLAYDPENKVLWVSEKKGKQTCLGGINIENIKKYKYKNGKSIKYDQFVQLEGIKAASYLTYYDGGVWVGLFNNKSNGKLNRYPIDANGVLSGESDCSMETDKNIQGLYISDDYSIMSKSYGPATSKVLVFAPATDDVDIEKLVAGEETALITYDDPPKLEQIGVYGNKSYFLYESSAFCYRQRGSANIDRVLSYELMGDDDWDDLDEAVKQLEKEGAVDNNRMKINEDLLPVQYLKELDVLGLFN